MVAYCFGYFLPGSECILAQAHCKSLQDPNHPVINLDHNGPCEHLTNESRIVSELLFIY